MEEKILTLDDILKDLIEENINAKLEQTSDFHNYISVTYSVVDQKYLVGVYVGIDDGIIFVKTMGLFRKIPVSDMGIFLKANGRLESGKFLIPPLDEPEKINGELYHNVEYGFEMYPDAYEKTFFTAQVSVLFDNIDYFIREFLSSGTITEENLIILNKNNG